MCTVKYPLIVWQTRLYAEFSNAILLSGTAMERDNPIAGASGWKTQTD